MSVSRLPSRQLRCLASPLLACWLSACGAAGGDEADGPPAFTGTGMLNPGRGNAGAPSTGSNGGTPSGTTPSGTTNPPVSGTTPSTNEGSQTGQVPVTGNMTNNSGNNGAAGASSGAGGAGSMGNTPMGNAGAAPMGAAGAGTTPVQNPPPPPVMLPTPPGQAFFFDDFEGGAAGTQPAAWDRWINYTTVAGNALGNPQFALLDDTESFRGNQSVHFHTEGATQPAMLTMLLPSGMNRIYIRAFVKSRIAVGGVAADSVSNHESLIGLRAVSNDGNDEIRFGGAKGALGFNAVGPGRNDAVAPVRDQWGSGPGLTPNMWQCVEIAFLNDGTPRATASVDGNVVRDVTSPAGWHIPVSQTWLNGLYKEVFIGWQSFSPQPANDVWMDDVVLSTQPIGCQ
jgi:hypothetical protein